MKATAEVDQVPIVPSARMIGPVERARRGTRNGPKPPRRAPGPGRTERRNGSAGGRREGPAQGGGPAGCHPNGRGGREEGLLLVAAISKASKGLLRASL